MSAWADAIEVARRDRSFIYVGPSDGWLAALRAQGVELSAHLDTSPPVEPSSSVSVLASAVPTRVVADEVDEPVSPLGPGWRAQRAEAASIAAFLDRHDPGRAASILSLHSVAPALARDRPTWAADADLACHLEAKASTGAVLDDVVPWVPAEGVPPSIDDGWFQRVTNRHGVDALAVQALGLSWYGERTWRCRSAVEVAAVVGRCGEVRIAPWIDGLPVNIAGAVSVDGKVVVLPPSRQLIVPDADRRPLYFGNVIGTLDDAAVDAVAGHARTVGDALATRGYVGMFGVDGILSVDGVRYHDLNPRVNGAMVAYDRIAPVVVGLLLFSGWAERGPIAVAEQELEAAARAAPSARWRLGVAVERSGPMGPVPAAGLYRLDPTGPTLAFLEPDSDIALSSADDDVVLIRPRTLATTIVQAGHRAPLADLWCAADLGDALVLMHGSQVVERMVGALRQVAHA